MTAPQPSIMVQVSSQYAPDQSEVVQGNKKKAELQEQLDASCSASVASYSDSSDETSFQGNSSLNHSFASVEFPLGFEENYDISNEGEGDMLQDIIIPLNDTSDEDNNSSCPSPQNRRRRRGLLQDSVQDEERRELLLDSCHKEMARDYDNDDEEADELDFYANELLHQYLMFQRDAYGPVKSLGVSNSGLAAGAIFKQ